MRSVRIAGGLAGLVVLTACTGTPGTPGTGAGSPADAAPASAGPSLTSGQGYSVSAALAQIPTTGAAGSATPAPSTGLWVTTADLTTATKDAGLTRPTSTDLDSVLKWLGPLNERPGSKRAAPVYVPLPTLFEPASSDGYAGFKSELGWSPLDADTFVNSTQSPSEQSFTVVTGVGDHALNADLPSIGGGVVTAGTGADDQTDLTHTTAARPLGAPLRLAQKGSTVAASSSTGLAKAWVSGQGGTLADDASFSAIADALDSAHVVSAELVRAPASWSVVLGEKEESQADKAGIEKVRSTVDKAARATMGLGWAPDGNRATVTIVYAFGSQDAATAASPVLKDQYAGHYLAGHGAKPIDSFFSDAKVAQKGSTVVVTAGLVGTTPASTPSSMVDRHDLPLW